MNITNEQTQKILNALELLKEKKLTDTQKGIVDEAYEAIKDSAKKQLELNQKSYERIKKKREENPSYARESNKQTKKRLSVADFIKE